VIGLLGGSHLLGTRFDDLAHLRANW